MIVYAICLTINVLGMGFLFYIHEQQKLLNTEFLKNAIVSNALLDMLKEKTEELERLVQDLEKEKK